MKLAVCVVVACLSLAAAALAFGPVGAELRISTTGPDGNTGRYAAEPDVAFNPEQNEFLVTWDGTGLPTDGEAEIFGQRVTAAGEEAGTDFRISNVGSDGDAARSVFSSAAAYGPAAGEYLVVWRADGLATVGEAEIFGQRVSAAGAEVGTDFRISNAGTDGDAGRDAVEPDVAHDPGANRFLVVWQADAGATDDEQEIHGQLVDAAGAAVGGDFVISSTGAANDAARDARGAAVAFNPASGEYLVVWEADGLATDDEHEIFGRRVSAAGAPIGGDLRISSTGTDGDADRDAASPAVAAAGGGFLVAWAADGLVTDDEFETFGQRLDGAGAAVGGIFRISEVGTDGDAGRDAGLPTLASDPAAGEVLAVWHADGLATDEEREVFGQRLTNAGEPVGGDFRISTTGPDGDPAREASFASVAFDPDGRHYLAAWQAEFQADDEYEIYGRRVQADPPPTPTPTVTPTATPDAEVVLDVRAKARQRAKRVVVRAGCGAEACDVAAKVKVRAGARRFTLGRVAADAAAGARARLAAKLPRAVRRAVGRALERDKRATAAVAVTARDAAGNRARRNVKVRFRR